MAISSCWIAAIPFYPVLDKNNNWSKIPEVGRGQIVVKRDNAALMVALRILRRTACDEDFLNQAFIQTNQDLADCD